MTIKAADTKAINKVAFTALIGTSVEWYDFVLYGTAAALVFPKLFFPAGLSPLIGLLASLSTFAVGFLARPLGGIIFGHYGDKVGRKKVLVIALILMGSGTTLIGLLPTYAMAGPIAPLLLITLRIVQGLAFGGQWGGAVLLVTETAPAGRRGFYGSFAQAGVCIGVVVANLLFLLISSNLSDDVFMTWGWRVPFLLSVVLIGVALFVQVHLEDTPAFRQLAEIKKNMDAEQGLRTRAARRPAFEAIATYPKEIALAAGAFIAASMAFYILITFTVAYGTAQLGIERNTMLNAVMISAVVMFPVLLICAHISDKWGRKGIYGAGAVLLGVWSFALFPLIQTKDFLWITVAISVGQIGVAMMYGPQAAFLSETFSTKVRYSGASLGYQIGAVLGGALAPLIATALLAQFEDIFAVSVYMATICVITVICTLLLKETYKRDLHAV